MITKTDRHFDIAKLKYDIFEIIEYCPTKNGQICLTYPKHMRDYDSNERLWYGAGSLYDFDIRAFRTTEKEFDTLHEICNGTELEKFYNSCDNPGRFRIMIMDGPKCYTAHRDFNLRDHIAIQTNKNCFFVYPEDNYIKHIPADGFVYTIDARPLHTFVNGSREQRIHLVIDDLDSYKGI